MRSLMILVALVGMSLISAPSAEAAGLVRGQPLRNAAKWVTGASRRAEGRAVFRGQRVRAVGRFLFRGRSCSRSGCS